MSGRRDFLAASSKDAPRGILGREAPSEETKREARQAAEIVLKAVREKKKEKQKD